MERLRLFVGRQLYAAAQRYSMTLMAAAGAKGECPTSW